MAFMQKVKFRNIDADQNRLQAIIADYGKQNLVVSSFLQQHRDCVKNIECRYINLNNFQNSFTK